MIAGNKTLEGAKAIGLEDCQVVKSDGTKLIAVQRTDLDINDKAARELAIADNRASELGLEWDPDVLKALETEVDVDLSARSGMSASWCSSGLRRTAKRPSRKWTRQQQLQGSWQDGTRADLGIPSASGKGNIGFCAGKRDKRTMIMHGC